MVAIGEPAMYCEDWLMKSESLPCGNISSQKIAYCYRLYKTPNVYRFMKTGDGLGASRRIFVGFVALIIMAHIHKGYGD